MITKRSLSLGFLAALCFASASQAQVFVGVGVYPPAFPAVVSPAVVSFPGGYIYDDGATSVVSSYAPVFRPRLWNPPVYVAPRYVAPVFPAPAFVASTPSFTSVRAPFVRVDNLSGPGGFTYVRAPFVRINIARPPAFAVAPVQVGGFYR